MNGKPQQEIAGSTGLLSGVGIVAGLLALLGASCCVFPLLLAILGLGSAWFANFSFVVVYRPYFMGLALILIAIGWIMAFRLSRNWIVFSSLSLATVFLAGSYVVTVYEPQITRYLVAIWRS